MSWKKMITQRVGVEQLGDINSFLSHHTIPQRQSPIDSFYSEARELLRTTPTTLSSDEWTGCSHVVTLVSLTENYFRSILGELLKICHVTQKNAAGNSVNFGSILWHPSEFISRGAFEHVSFSDSSKITKVTRDFVGIELNAASGLLPILNEFSKVCELRHGIVHSGRYIAGKNAIILDIPSASDFIKVSIGYGQLQSVAAICTTLVVAYNQKLFETCCQRWATSWRQNPLWTVEMENDLIKKIWYIFHSRIDETNGTIEETGTWVKCRNLLKTEFNL